MREPTYSTQFKKDFKRCQKRGYSMQSLLAVMSDLENKIPLDPKHKEHLLIGDYAGCLECHVESDWLAIYQIDDDKTADEEKEVYFVRTGTHSDLFK